MKKSKARKRSLRISNGKFVICWKIVNEETFEKSDEIARFVFKINNKFIINQFILKDGKTLFIKDLKGQLYEVKKRISHYEYIFYKWLEDAQMRGYVEDFVYEPKTFVVFDKINSLFYNNHKKKLVNKVIISKINYTPDFVISFTNKFFNDFPNAKYDLILLASSSEPNKYYVDIKSKVAFGKNGSNREFPSKRALLYAIGGIYTTRVTLDIKKNWFSYTYVPKSMLAMATSQLVKDMFRKSKIL